MTMIENMSLKNGCYIIVVSSKDQSKCNEVHTSLEVQEEKLVIIVLKMILRLLNVLEKYIQHVIWTI